MELGLLPGLSDCYSFGKPSLSSLHASTAFPSLGVKL